MGISLARFNGREYTTRYEYDQAGRLVRSTTESEWDDQQQGWMLALAAYRSGLCPHCGGPLDVCTDPAGQGRWTVPPPTRCHATTALSVARARYKDTPQPEALLWRTQRR